MRAHRRPGGAAGILRLPYPPSLALRTRLLFGMGIMLLPLVILGAIALYSLQGLADAIDDVVQEATEELATALQLRALIEAAMLVNRDALAAPVNDPAARERVLSANRSVDKAFEAIGAGPFALAEERALLRSARDEWRQGRELSEALLLRNPRSGETIGKEMARANAYHDRALESLDRVHALSQQEMSAQLATAVSVRRKVFVGIASVLIIGLGAAIMVGMGLARSILGPLGALETGARRLGTGDLSHRVPVTGEDELAQVARTFNVMADRLAQSQAALRGLSTRDGLTGLYNYREFHRQATEEMERCRRYARPFSLLMLDIDHFKTINDRYGHLAGDDTLRALAGAIQREVRPTDVVARYGGEEFVMVLPETTGAGALALAERLRRSVADHAIALTKDQTLSLTVSIGLGAYPEDADSLHELLGAADQALYVAKSGGRNRACRSGTARDRAGEVRPA